jgi:hypothetical protein
MTAQRPSKIWQGAALAELTALGTDDGLEALDFGLVEAGTPGLYQATTVLASSSTWTLIGGGAGIPVGLSGTQETTWVDGTNGNDGTGMVARRDLPFQTISAALAALPGIGTVFVLPGEYTEASGVVIPESVALVSLGGWEVTSIIQGGAPAPGTIMVDMGINSAIQGFSIEIPDDATSIAVRANLVSGDIASIRYVTVFSQTPTANGIGFQNTGTGKIIAEELRWTGAGGCDAFMECASGIFAVESTHLPNSAAAVNDNVRVLAGRFQGSNINCGSANTVDGFDIRGGTVVLFSPNIFQVTNGIHLSTGITDVTASGGSFQSIAGNSVLVDPSWNATDSIVRLNSSLDPSYSFPPSAIDSDFGVLSFTRETDIQVPSLSILGTDLHLGFPEKGLELQAGNGPSYARGVRVLNFTGATAGTDGTLNADVTAAATSSTGSTFGFPTGAVGDAIYWTTARVDSGGAPLPHYGVRLVQQTGAVIPAGTEIVAECWVASAGTWREMPVMATSEPNEFRYANQILLRSGTTEDLRFGVGFTDEDWMGPDGRASTKTIDGTNAYWFRLRVVGAAPLTTPPVLEWLRIDPSHTEVNAAGRISFHGEAHSVASIFTADRGESGGVIAASPTVGTGAAPQETWSHQIPNALFNGAGDALYTIIKIGEGTATQYPLRFRAAATFTGVQPITTSPTFTVSAISLQVAGVQIADPAGGATPIARDPTTTEALDARPADYIIKPAFDPGVLPATLDNRIVEVDFPASYAAFPPSGPARWFFDISNFYAGDIVAIRFEYTSDGSPAQDAIIWDLSVESVNFSNGGEITNVR